MRYGDRELTTIQTQMQGLRGFRASYLVVYNQLNAWENAKSGTTEPSQSKIASTVGYSRETVSRAVCWLRPRGFLRTIQLPNWMNGKKLRGRLRYWMTRERGQIGWLKRRYLGSNAAKQRIASLLKPSQSSPTAVRRNLLSSCSRSWKETSKDGLTSRDACSTTARGNSTGQDHPNPWRERGEVPPSRLLDRVYSRCDLRVTSKSRSEPYSDDMVVPDENLISPQLELALRKGRWRS